MQCLKDDNGHCVNTSHVKALQEHILELEAPEQKGHSCRRFRNQRRDCRFNHQRFHCRDHFKRCVSSLLLAKSLSDQPEILECPVKDAWNARYVTEAR